MTAIFKRIHMSVKQVVALVLFMLISALAQMLIPSLLSQMIDSGVGESNEKLIIAIGIAMIVLAVFACVMNVVSTTISASVTTKFSADIRQEIFHKVQSFSAAEIDKFGTASLIARSTTDVTTIQTFFSMLFRIGLMAPAMAVIGLILSVATAGEISMVLAIAIPVLVVVATALIIGASRSSVKLRKKIDSINQLFLETLEGVRVIRAFNKQKHEIDRFGETNQETAELSRKQVNVSTALFPVVNMLFGFTTVAVMAVGTGFVIFRGMDVGVLVSATQYIMAVG